MESKNTKRERDSHHEPEDEPLLKRPRVEPSPSPAAAAAARVAIIGTAGRINDARNRTLSLKLYQAMIEAAARCIEDTFGLDLRECVLVSGGAAWADHVAVDLFLQKRVRGLTLLLPSNLTAVPGAFGYVDTGVVDFIKNPGGTSNHYHRLFSKKLGRNSLEDLHRARDAGAHIDVSTPGFFARNGGIARHCTHMIAFTWSTNGVPSDGGTLKTWKQCKLDPEHKKHIALGSLVVT